MRIVFMGTPDFAIPALCRLIDEHEVVCVYTREPKPAGRGNKLSKSPVHLLAEANNIEVRCPRSLRNEDEQRKFRELNADAAIVAAYGLILPKPILEAYPLGCLNIHASLLPRWRGAAPIQRCIEAGDILSGVTVMQVAEGLDTGDMLAKSAVKISDTMTGGELHDLLAQAGADLLSAVLKDIKSYKPQPQNDDASCYAEKLEKDECQIDFSLPLPQLYNKIRAFSPFPGMFFTYKGERFKIIKAEILPAFSAHNPGEIISGKDDLIIAGNGGNLRIKEIQRQGKKAMPIADMLRGFSFEQIKSD